MGSPEITFINCPSVTEQKNISIQGKINGDNTDAKLYLNDQEVTISYDGSFSKIVSLTEGDNSYVFRAVNTYGKSTSVVKTIKYISQIVAPTLTVDEVPTSVDTSTVTISGNMSDTLDPAAKVYVNDQLVSNVTGNWTTTLTLTEGTNKIIINATNSYGKSVTIVKTIICTSAVQDQASELPGQQS